MRARAMRGKLAPALLVGAAFGVALGASAVAALAEPTGGKQGAARAPAGAEGAAASEGDGSGNKGGFAPDPPARASTKQWVFDVRVQKGKPSIERARSANAARPTETARVMGRYAIELYVGQELLDRVRFNVPLGGDGPPEDADRPTKNPFRRPRFEDVTTKLRVQMADNPRAAYVALVDRATESVERFEWPPSESGQLVPLKLGQQAGQAGGAPESKGDAGAPSDGGADGGAADASAKDAPPRG